MGRAKLLPGAFYPASVLFGLLVVVDADKQQVVGILLYLCRVLSPFDLLNGRVGIFVVLQLKDDSRRSESSRARTTGCQLLASMAFTISPATSRLGI